MSKIFFKGKISKKGIVTIMELDEEATKKANNL
jgi:hypothetical protein